MRIAAYCRVSTDKADQLNSLEAQKKFFMDYVQRTGNTLVRLYADEGISGTKIKNRKEFLKMMADAQMGFFDLVVVKDISQFARNTVDLLQNIKSCVKSAGKSLRINRLAHSVELTARKKARLHMQELIIFTVTNGNSKGYERFWVQKEHRNLLQNCKV